MKNSSSLPQSNYRVTFLPKFHLPTWYTFLLLVLLGCSSVLSAEGIKHVFIISLDQVLPSNIEEAKMPFLQQLQKDETHAAEAYTIVPSITLPSHVSMLTGVGIQKHQILWNDFKNKIRVSVPTIFSLAKEKDKSLKTAMVVSKEKFETLHLPETVDAFVWPKDNVAASEIGKAAVKVIQELKPNLCFIHFGDPDFKGHAFGVHSPEKLKVLADTDVAIRQIFEAIEAAGIADSSVVMITADHGGHDSTKEVVNKKTGEKEQVTKGTHGTPETADVMIPWIVAGAHVKKAYTVTQPVQTIDTAATALWLLDVPIPESVWGRPVTAAFQ